MKKKPQECKKLKQGKVKRLLSLGGGVLAIGSAMLFVQASDVLVVTTRLDEPVQTIGKIMFAIPKNDGNWQSTGQIPMSAENEKVTVNGSLLTNAAQGNVIQIVAPRNVSVLGGKGNKMLATENSTLMGGSGNSTTATESFVGGGEQNVITGSTARAVILGGKGNTLSGNDSIILGGEKNTISGSSSVTLGNKVSISGDLALAAGSGVKLQASQSFIWNGSGTFTVTGGNLFVVNAQKGMVVRTDTPRPFAVLTVNGDVRIEEEVTKNSGITCTGTTAGTIKTVSQSDTNYVCSCLCDGKYWKPVIDTMECRKTCGYQR